MHYTAYWLFGRGFLACDGPIIASRQWLYAKPYFSYRGQRYTLFL